MCQKGFTELVTVALSLESALNYKWRIDDGERERYTSRERNLNKSTEVWPSLTW